jgi:phosphatidylserine decarboxylase
MEMLKRIIPPIHKEGYYFVCIFAVVTVFLGYFFESLSIVGTIATIWCFFFFRDPIRVTPINENYVISPADGIIQNIVESELPEELNEETNTIYRRISIFLNVFDVHVNRVPMSGTIQKLRYNPGKFLNASLDKASKDNERQTVLMQTSTGQQMAFVQIAGLIARRIVCDLEENQEVKAGSRYGIIRFGSRVDLYLPKEAAIKVLVGQRVLGGETVLADFSENAEDVKGEIR